MSTEINPSDLDQAAECIRRCVGEWYIRNEGEELERTADRLEASAADIRRSSTTWKQRAARVLSLLDHLAHDPLVPYPVQQQARIAHRAITQEGQRHRLPDRERRNCWTCALSGPAHDDCNAPFEQVAGWLDAAPVNDEGFVPKDSDNCPGWEVIF